MADHRTERLTPVVLVVTCVEMVNLSFLCLRESGKNISLVMHSRGFGYVNRFGGRCIQVNVKWETKRQERMHYSHHPPL